MLKRLFFYLFLWVLMVAAYWASSRFLFPEKKSSLVQIRELERKNEELWALEEGIEAVKGSKKYSIIGGGKLKSHEGWSEDSVSPDIFVLHGTDYRALKKFILEDFSKTAETKKVIITALAMKRILLEENEDLFSVYFDSFKKSGDIFGTEGTAFYYLDELELSMKENLSGGIISFPEGFYFSKVKNYGLAHLIQNHFSLQGFENPIKFLEVVHFPKPKGFKGSFQELVEQAGQEYRNKYLSRMILVDYQAGRLIPRDILPFIEPKKTDKVLPLFKLIRLSSNVYFSGLKTA